jgi:8-oxo-dGTP diphosphatase
VTGLLDAVTRLRHSVRALLVDERDRLLLYHFQNADSRRVWAAPGGGVEPGESDLEALRRELREETGLNPPGEPRHVWHQEVVAAGHIPGYDGVVNDYYLIRTNSFALPGDRPEEDIQGFRWWLPSEIQTYEGPDLFSPRDLSILFPPLLSALPPVPLPLGL